RASNSCSPLPLHVALSVMTFLQRIEQSVEARVVVFNTGGQVDVFFRPRVARPPRVVEHPFTQGLVGFFLLFGLDRGVDVEAARVDRKSTRLNSSHVKTSYA